MHLKTQNERSKFSLLYKTFIGRHLTNFVFSCPAKLFPKDKRCSSFCSTFIHWVFFSLHKGSNFSDELFQLYSNKQARGENNLANVPSGRRGFPVKSGSIKRCCIFHRVPTFYSKKITIILLSFCEKFRSSAASHQA